MHSQAQRIATGSAVAIDPTGQLPGEESARATATVASSVRSTWAQQLLTNAVADTNGTWVNVEGVFPLGVQIAGITTANVEIRVSLQATAPVAADHQILAGLVNVADGLLTLDYPVRWIKARITGWVAGTINAYGWGLASA